MEQNTMTWFSRPVNYGERTHEPEDGNEDTAEDKWRRRLLVHVEGDGEQEDTIRNQEDNQSGDTSGRARNLKRELISKIKQKVTKTNVETLDIQV